jgi:hypothetical protein
MLSAGSLLKTFNSSGREGFQNDIWHDGSPLAPNLPGGVTET